MPLPLLASEIGGDFEIARSRPLLGTLVEIRAGVQRRDHRQMSSSTAETAQLHAAVDAAFAQIEHVHHLMSYHDPDSELARLNREAVERPQRVSLHTYAVLSAAVRIARLSEGAFDPCVGACLETWGYLPPSRVRTESGFASWQDIELLEEQRVRFKRPLRVDLGGIAKGYAVDLATQSLQQANVQEIVVNAGGDLRVSGTRVREIVLRHPRTPGVGGTSLELESGALATSAAYFSRKRVGSGEVSALLDPRSRAAYLGHESISVHAGDCITADALTKVVLFAPPAVAERVLADFDAEAFVLASPA
jgi:thiamine biosynthesis lipoprotein